MVILNHDLLLKERGITMDRWEYKILNTSLLNIYDVERMINKLGGKGWEVINIEWNYSKVYLKRRK